MRIIAGTWKGRRLKAPSGRHVRPTSDKVKGAIFNILGTKTLGARVLDLFAGTGSLALEALSRGAASAVLVEQNGRTMQIIRDNVGKMPCPEGVVLCETEAGRFLRTYAGEPFDLVFVDPPYSRGLGEKVLPELAGKLSRDGVIVVETSSDETLAVEAPFVIQISKVYGDTKVWFLQKIEEQQ